MTENLVLVIDPDPRTSSLLLGTAPLQEMRFKVRVAEDGVRAFRALREQTPDLVVLSDALPGRLSWHEVIESLRRGGYESPVILLTQGEVDEQLALQMGVRQILTHPLTAFDLRRCLADAMADVRYQMHGDGAATPADADTPPLAPEFEALYAAGTAFTRLNNLDELLHRIVDSAAFITNSEQARLLLWEDDEQQLQLRALKNRNDPLAHTVRLAANDPIADRVSDTKQPLRLTVEDLADFGFTDHTHAAMYVPVQTATRWLGALGVSRLAGTPNYTQSDQRLLKAVADYAAIAVENVRMVNSLQDRNQALEAALSQAQEAEQVKTTLLQNLSHELRTPLVVIKGITDMLYEDDLAPLPDELRPSVEKLQSRVNELAHMIDNAVAVHEPNLLQMNCEPLALQDVIRTAIQSLAENAERAQVSVVPSLPPVAQVVIGDYDLLVQLFHNLLDNAIKFSPHGGLITIDAQPLNDHWLQVTLSDSGVGIPEDKLTRIFDPFYMAEDGETRRFSGAGLGLTAAKHIVEALGGLMTAESVSGQGTVIVFTLPRTEAALAQSGLMRLG